MGWVVGVRLALWYRAAHAYTWDMSWSSTAIFYDQLRTLLNAGMPIGKALALAGASAGSPHRQWGARWSAGCQQGLGLADQLQGVQEAPLVVALVRAGENSGALPELCGEISAYFRHALALRTMVVGRLAYPLILLHVTLVAVAMPAVFMHGGSPLLILAGPLGLWLVVGGMALALRLTSRDVLARMALLPGIRGITDPLVAGNACLVLRASLGAGMLVPAAHDLAAGACANRVIAKRLSTAASGVTTGELPNLTAALAACSFPAEVVQLVENAELSGSLEATLGRCATLQQERFRFRTEWAARIVTGTIYGLAMLAAAAVVIGFYANYMGMINQVANSVGE